jgi:hypothetical protein
MALVAVFQERHCIPLSTNIHCNLINQHWARRLNLCLSLYASPVWTWHELYIHGQTVLLVSFVSVMCMCLSTLIFHSCSEHGLPCNVYSTGVIMICHAGRAPPSNSVSSVLVWSRSKTQIVDSCLILRSVPLEVEVASSGVCLKLWSAGVDSTRQNRHGWFSRPADVSSR